MTGGEFCSAIKCSNSRKKKPEMSFFRFPKDEERSKRWVQNSRRADLVGKSAEYLFNSCVLCAEHFEDSQFMNAQARNRLVWNAIPTKFNVPSPPPQKRLSSKRPLPKKRSEPMPWKVSKQFEDGGRPEKRCHQTAGPLMVPLNVRGLGTAAMPSSFTDGKDQNCQEQEYKSSLGTCAMTSTCLPSADDETKVKMPSRVTLNIRSDGVRLFKCHLP